MSAPLATLLLLQATADTTAAADTTGAMRNIGRDVGDAGRLLISGQWELFWSRIYEGMGGLVVSFVPKLLTAIVVFVILYVGFRVLGSLLHQVLNRSRRVDSGLQTLFLKTFRVIGSIFIALMVLAQFDIDVSALLAGLGIIGIAVGFAARDTLENFISGITILIDKPFRVSDNVQVEDVFGTVEEITLRSTRLRTLNNEIMVMPNLQMINQKLINHTMLGLLRVEVFFGIAYKESPEEARQVVLKLTEGDSRLHPDYPPKVVVTTLNDSSVDMKLHLFLTNPKLEVPVRFEYTEKIFNALTEAGIEIPFPHLQLFIDEAKGLEGTVLKRTEPPSGGDGA